MGITSILWILAILRGVYDVMGPLHGAYINNKKISLKRNLSRSIGFKKS